MLYFILVAIISIILSGICFIVKTPAICSFTALANASFKVFIFNRRFLISMVSASIAEGKENGTFVTRVEAFDKDEGSNTNNLYMILSGNEKGRQTIFSFCDFCFRLIRIF